MAVPYTFATQTTSIPLAELDTNFSTPITIGTTVIPLGNVAPILENVTLGNVVIASGNVTLTNVNVINATITQATITTANVTTANITSAFITTANIATANVVTIRATTANIATANVTAMEAVAANVTTLRSTTINVATANVSAMEAVSANVTTIRSTTANLTTANVTTLIASVINVATANVTTLITAGITDSGNLTFTGTGNRIIGDFTNAAAVASRVLFQTTTANSQTSLGIIPSGTSSLSQFVAYNNSDVSGATAFQTAQLVALSTEASIRSSIGAGASYLPITFYTGGSERARIATDGNVAIGTATTTGAKFIVNANTVLPATAPTIGTSLWVTGTDAVNGRILLDSFGSSSNFSFRSSNGTAAAPTASLSYGTLGTIAAFGYGATAYPSTARSSMVFLAAENWTDTAQGTFQLFSTTAIGSTTLTEKMRIDGSGNTYVETGNLWQYSPAPTALAAGANSASATNLQGGMFSAAQATAVTLTMPTGTAIDTGFPTAPNVDIGFYFYVINTGSALGAVTVAVNTNVTSLGSLVVAIGTSAQFRLRRTAANTYVMYRLS